jgi:protein involved in polysaccharide export with SLBB domain
MKLVVGWCVLGVVCMAGLGCTFTVNTNGYSTPQQPVPPHQGQEATADGIQTASHRVAAPDSFLRPGDGDRMVAAPETAPSPQPQLQPQMERPGCVGCADANVAMPPGMQKAYGEQPGDGMAPGGYHKLPTELDKRTHPAYIVEPPDILLIDASRLVPKPPYIIQPLDVLIVQATGTDPAQPINGAVTVGPDGSIALGFGYGSVRVGGLTLEKAQNAVRTQLEKTLKNPQVTIGLGAFQAIQQVRGQHLVRADGTVSLGVYGCVYIAGMSLCQAETVLEQHLSQFFKDPELSLDVFAYNSKAYYVIFDGGGYGQQVLKFPSTGNETVLDAIYNAGGLPAVSSRRRIWVARPTPAFQECVEILPVDWLAIVQSGSTRTNYQLFPGDRVYVHADPLICFDNFIAKVLSPVQRILNVTLLGTSVANSFRNNRNGNGSTAFVTAVAP